MPRDGSDNYTQPFPIVEEGTTIESTVYNGFTTDVAQDLNWPRPIVAGGTGASNADGALLNLSAEKFKQVVTNWDSMAWMAGSFYAATTAIGSAPIASHAFAGITYYANATDLVCEATDISDPVNPDKYIRIMASGVWSSWTRLNPNTSSANLGEYTFNNQVTFPPASGQIRFNNATQNSTTEVFISHLTATGVDNSSQITAYLLSGVDFIVQDKDEGNKYKIFTTTAAAVLSGGDFRVTATLKIAGIDLVSAQRMVLTASSETLRIQQRQLIYAAPFDALAYNGMQINGSFDAVQEKGLGTTTIVNNQYICDNWKLAVNGAPAVTALISGSALTPGFTNQLYLGVGTAAVSIAATDIAGVFTAIEGYRVARLAWGTASARPITIGFWSGHSRTGIYTGVVRNGAQDRSYGFTYTQATANTMQYNTVTIPGDTTGTWLKNNNAGMHVAFAMATGATYALPAANVWTSGGPYAGVTGQVNGVQTLADAFRLEGVVILPGTEAPSAAQSSLIMRPLDQELIACMRYFQKSYAYATQPGSITDVNCLWTVNGPTANLYAMVGLVCFPVVMRTSPSVAFYSTATGTSARIRQNNAAVDVVGTTNAVGERGFSLNVNNVSSGAYESLKAHYTADARL